MECCVVGCIVLDRSKDNNGFTINCLTVKVEVLWSFQPKHSSAAEKNWTFRNVSATPQISHCLDVFLQIFNYLTFRCVIIFFTMSGMQLLTKWVHYPLQWCVLLFCLHLYCTLQTI